jgi:oligopeptide transport system ATP-binding protein
MPWIRAAAPFDGSAAMYRWERALMSQQENAALLVVDDLRVQFETPEGTVYAVNGISYRVKPGEAVALVGESGCGKSVSMMSILGLIPIPPGKIVSGSAIWQGRDLLHLPEEEMERVRGGEIGMIFQDPMTSLNPVLSIERQLTEALRKHYDMEAKTARKRGVELLELVGIPDAARRLGEYPHQFSGGMRQRAMIAMMLACDPNLLIADEPTTALDVTIQAQIVDLVMRMREQIGMAMIWITHDLGVVAGLADRVLVMYAGFIVEEAGVDDIYDNPKHPYTVALLGALPRVDRRRESRLQSIPGAPPNLLVEPHGCPFAPRCTHVVDRCLAEMPPLEPVAPAHKAACWIDLRTGEPR